MQICQIDGFFGNAEGQAANGAGSGRKDIASDVARLLKMVRDRKLDPVIVFSFSRR